MAETTRDGARKPKKVARQMNYILLACNILLLVAGQTLWKYGIGGQQLHSVRSVILMLFSPWVLAGILLYGVATVISIFLLSRMPLSLVYPLQSLTYLLVLFVSLFIFREHISAWRWIGVCIIMLGASLVVK